MAPTATVAVAGLGKLPATKNSFESVIPSSVETYGLCMEDRVAMRKWKEWLAFNGTDLKLAALISALVFGTGMLMRWLPV
jgi:hypothetical protein